MTFSSKRLCAVASLAIAIWLTNATAHAEDEGPEELIRQGVRLRKRGEDAKAHGYFQRAYDIARTPRTSAQLGLSDLSVNQWLDAEVHLSEALSYSDPWIDANKGTLESSRQTARTHLGKIEIDGAASASTVEATGRPATPLPADGAVWVSPGTVTLKLQAAGFKPATEEATVSLGGVAQVHVTMARLEPEPSTGGPKVETAAAGAGSGPAGGMEGGATASGGTVIRSPAEEAHHRRSLRIASAAVAGGGAAIAVAGLVLWRIGVGKGDAITSDGTAMPQRPYNPSNGNYQTFESVGVGMLIGGGAVVAAGAIGYLLNRDRRAATTEQPAISVSFGPGQVGALFAGRF
jgi:hypothetical protein